MKYRDTVLKIAEEVRNRNNGRNDWNEVSDRVRKLFPDKRVTPESVRGINRRHGKKHVDPNISSAKRADNLAGRESLEERILYRIKYKTDIKALSDILEVTVNEILLEVAKLQLKGFTGVKIWTEGKRQYIQNLRKAKEFGNEEDLIDKWHNSEEIVIGIVADTHLGSEYCDEESLNHFYDLAKERGIDTILHAGDIFEGYKNTRVETFLGNKAIGFQEQLEYGIKHYPKRDGITTYVISGNHDEWYIQQGLADIVKTFAGSRTDIKFLGNSYARIWLTPEVDITLYHPNDGSSLNVFHKLQNFINRGQDKVSKINVLGHYHKLGWISFNDIHGIYPASFQKQSKWMNMNNLRSEVGAIILTLKVDKDTGELLSLIFEHIDYNTYK